MSDANPLLSCKKCGYSSCLSPKITYLPVTKKIAVECIKCKAKYFEAALDAMTDSTDCNSNG